MIICKTSRPSSATYKFRAQLHETATTVANYYYFVVCTIS